MKLSSLLGFPSGLAGSHSTRTTLLVSHDVTRIWRYPPQARDPAIPAKDARPNRSRRCESTSCRLRRPRPSCVPKQKLWGTLTPPVSDAKRSDATFPGRLWETSARSIPGHDPSSVRIGSNWAIAGPARERSVAMNTAVVQRRLVRMGTSFRPSLRGCFASAPPSVRESTPIRRPLMAPGRTLESAPSSSRACRRVGTPAASGSRRRGFGGVSIACTRALRM